jgi:hypothetical protein
MLFYYPLKKLQQPLFKRWLHAHRGVGLALVWRWFRRWIVHHAALVTNAKPTRTNANGES